MTAFRIVYQITSIENEQVEEILSRNYERSPKILFINLKMSQKGATCDVHMLFIYNYKESRNCFVKVDRASPNQPDSASCL